MSKSPNVIKGDYMQYIDEHDYLPDFMKKEIKDMVARQFNIMSQQIGTIELTYRRTIEFIKDSKE